MKPTQPPPNDDIASLTKMLLRLRVGAVALAVFMPLDLFFFGLVIAEGPFLLQMWAVLSLIFAWELRWGANLFLICSLAFWLGIPILLWQLCGRSALWLKELQKRLSPEAEQHGFNGKMPHLQEMNTLLRLLAFLYSIIAAGALWWMMHHLKDLGTVEMIVGGATVAVLAILCLLHHNVHGVLSAANRRLNGENIALGRMARRLSLAVILATIALSLHFWANIWNGTNMTQKINFFAIVVHAVCHGFLICTLLNLRAVAFGTAKVLDEKTVH